VFVVCVLCLVGLCSVRECKDPYAGLLHREQTEEWRGGMQLIFLCYHYFNAVETYKPIRIMVGEGVVCMHGMCTCWCDRIEEMVWVLGI